MPKATIYKHGDFSAGENEIRAADDRITPAPTRDLMLTKQRNEDLLR